MKNLLTLLLCIFPIILFNGCNNTSHTNSLKVGVMAGPEAELMKAAQQVAQERYGLKVNIVTFSDYSIPNRALAEGDIDANSFQSKPFLDADVKAHGYKLAIAGKTFLFPLGVYSVKIKNLDQLPISGIIAIASDPTDESRALLLLQKAGLIKLRPGVTITATPKDIIANPKYIKFIALDASNLPRTLQDVSAAVINNNFAVAAGFSLKDAIYKESTDSLYTNLLVVRAGTENDPRIKELLAAIQSPQVVAKAKEIFHGGAIPGWNQDNAETIKPMTRNKQK
ncbi:MAG: MetQ/NlpA family ABC transporter substrate-binding protein [Pseudomonadota bacterium]